MATFYKGGGVPVIEGTDVNVGLNTVDWIKKEINLPELPLSAIAWQIHGLEKSVLFLEVTEKQARSLPRKHFHNDGYKVEVCVQGCLHSYLEKQLVTKVDAVGELFSVGISYILTKDSEKAIVRDWIKAGAPLIW